MIISNFFKKWENCLPGRWEKYLPDYWEITLPKHWEKYLTFTLLRRFEETSTGWSWNRIGRDA